jgi:hypothetical protein
MQVLLVVLTLLFTLAAALGTGTLVLGALLRIMSKLR